MKSLILALAILCGVATCEAEAADSFYFSNGRFSFEIGPQPRYYVAPVPMYPVYPYYDHLPQPYPYYHSQPAPQRHYHYHNHAPRHNHGHRHHRGCN